MAENKRLENRNLHETKDALLVLQNLDFERLDTLGLDAQIVLYLGNSAQTGVGARYEGRIEVVDEHPLGFSHKIVTYLPTPKYTVWENGKRTTVDAREKVPYLTLFSHPALLEFVITDTPGKGFEGLCAMRDIIVPDLFKRGYDQRNSDHTSKFWFYMGNKDKMENVLCLDAHPGLAITKTEINKVKIFTEQDVKKLLELTPEKK